jgi:hypothetical protein
MTTYKELIQRFFNGLNKDSMHLVSEFYASDCVFEDPLTSRVGSSDIERYYAHLYQNVQEISFVFEPMSEENHQVAAPWVMHMRAAPINKGNVVHLKGLSLIRFDPQRRQAIFQRDYYDMGAFIYEHVPVLKNVIAYVKRRLNHR